MSNNPVLLHVMETETYRKENTNAVSFSLDDFFCDLLEHDTEFGMKYTLILFDKKDPEKSKSTVVFGDIKKVYKCIEKISGVKVNGVSYVIPPDNGLNWGIFLNRV